MILYKVYKKCKCNAGWMQSLILCFSMPVIFRRLFVCSLSILSLLVLLAEIDYRSERNAIINLSAGFSTARQRTKTKRIIIHHDAVPMSDSVSLMDIRDFHRFTRGWQTGFAYSFYVGRSQTFQVHRMSDYTVHAGDANADGIAICVHGDFSKDKLSLRGYFRVAVVATLIMGKYHLSENDIFRHCDVQHTQCPGDLDIEKIKLMCKFLKWL